MARPRKDGKPSRPPRPPERRALTDRFVRAVAKGPERFRIWDTVQKGLALVVEPSGHKSYKLAYRFNGALVWLSLGTAKDDNVTNGVSLATARQAAKMALAKVTLGIDPQAERRASIGRARAAVSFETIARRYVEEFAKPSRRAWQQGDALRKRYVLPKLGKRTVTEIRRADIRAIFNDLTVVQGHPVLANQVLAAIGGVFSWAVKQEILEHNPARGVRRNPTKSRERILSEAEVPLFWRAFGEVDPVHGAALRMLLLCGQRPGEVAHMRREHLEIGRHKFTDANGRTIEAEGAWWSMPGEPDRALGWPGTKNGASHRCWLAPAAVAIVNGLDEGKGGPIFRGINGGALSRERLSKAMRAACEAAEVGADNRATPHDLRRTHGTTVTSLGFTREQMNRLQNHKEGGVGSIYDRFSYSNEARVIQEAVAARIMSLVEGGGADIVVEFSRARAS